MKNTKAVHPRHAELVEMLEDYLAETGKSARWLGLNTPPVNNPRLIANLKRGQHYHRNVVLALWERLRCHYEEQLAKLNAEEAAELPLAA